MESALYIVKRKKKAQVWVAKGTYLVDSVLVLPVNTDLIGGFEGNELSPVDIVDPTKTVIDFQNKYSSNFCWRGYEGSVIKNFTIKNGGLDFTYENVFEMNSKGTFYNCVLIDNYKKMKSFGGAISIYDAGKIKNCTIIRNGFNPNISLILDGTGLVVETGTIEDTIIWGNYSSATVKQIKSGNSAIFKNCAIDGGTLGLLGTFTECLELNGDNDNVAGPNFVDIASGNLKLKKTSPCIGKGVGGKNIGAFTGVEE